MMRSIFIKNQIFGRFLQNNMHKKKETSILQHRFQSSKYKCNPHKSKLHCHFFLKNTTKIHIQMQDLKTLKELLLKLQKKNGMSLVHYASKILSKIQWSQLINLKLSDKALIISILLDSLDKTGKLAELEKKLTILFMKANLKTTSITVTADLFIQTETTTLEIGWMERDQGTENWLTNQVGCMKVNGSTASSWEINDIYSLCLSFRTFI